jgi:hypothetical protein
MPDDDLQQTIDDLLLQAVEFGRRDYGVDLDFSPYSLQDLYKLLNRAHVLTSLPSFEGRVPERTVNVWGAYLGETLRRQYSGTWRENPAANLFRRYSVSTSVGNFFPMEQVYLRVVPGITNPQQLRAPHEPPTRRVTAVQWDPAVITAAFAAILLFLGSLVFIFHVI